MTLTYPAYSLCAIMVWMKTVGAGAVKSPHKGRRRRRAFFTALFSQFNLYFKLSHPWVLQHFRRMNIATLSVISQYSYTHVSCWMLPSFSVMTGLYGTCLLIVFRISWTFWKQGFLFVHHVYCTRCTVGLEGGKHGKRVVLYYASTLYK